MIPLTTKYLDQKLKAQTKELKNHTEEQVAELAGMVKKGFDNLEEKLDVRQKVEKLEHQMKQIHEALHL